MPHLDTHLSLWAAFEPTPFSAKAAKQLRPPKTLLDLRSASSSEVAIKTPLSHPDSVVDCPPAHSALADSAATGWAARIPGSSEIADR